MSSVGRARPVHRVGQVGREGEGPKRTVLVVGEAWSLRKRAAGQG